MEQIIILVLIAIIVFLFYLLYTKSKIIYKKPKINLEKIESEVINQKTPSICNTSFCGISSNSDFE
jgi:hypothetical protein